MGANVAQRWAVTSGAGMTGNQQHAAQQRRKRRVYVSATGTFNLAPQEIWRLLTLPEGDPIFRVEQRRQLLHEPAKGKMEEEVVFVAPVRVLFWKAQGKTKVRQCIDASNPEMLTVNFSLINSSLMSHLTGSWQLQQLEPRGPFGQPPRTRVTYSFEMWPKGMPPGLSFMPGVTNAMKGAVHREAEQLFDKMQLVADKVGPGVPLAAALTATAGEVAMMTSSTDFKVQPMAVDTVAASP